MFYILIFTLKSDLSRTSRTNDYKSGAVTSTTPYVSVFLTCVLQEGVGCPEWRRGSHTRTQTHCEDRQLHSGGCGFCERVQWWDFPTALWLSSQDSGCLLTGGNDKLLRIYDLSNTDTGDLMVPWVYCGLASSCLIAVLCSSSGDRRSYVGY